MEFIIMAKSTVDIVDGMRTAIPMIGEGKRSGYTDKFFWFVKSGRKKVEKLM